MNEHLVSKEEKLKKKLYLQLDFEILKFSNVSQTSTVTSVQDPHSGSEIDAKIQQQLVFKYYISELLKIFTISLFIYKSFRDTKLTKLTPK